MPLDVAISLLPRQLAEHGAVRMGRSIDQEQQRKDDADRNAFEDAQRQLGDDHDRGDAELQAASNEQLAQIAGFGKMKHGDDYDGGKRRMRHAPEQRGQENQRQQAKNRRDDIGKLRAAAGSHGYGGLGEAANDEEAAEQPTQDVGGPMRNQLLVRIDFAATLHCCGVRRAERLGITDQYDGERSGSELSQYGGVKLGQREVRQAGREVADDVDASNFATDQANEDGGREHDDERRRHAWRQAAKQQHRREAEQASHPWGERSVRQMLKHEPKLGEEVARGAANP